MLFFVAMVCWFSSIATFLSGVKILRRLAKEYDNIAKQLEPIKPEMVPAYYRIRIWTYVAMFSSFLSFCMASFILLSYFFK